MVFWNSMYWIRNIYRWDTFKHINMTNIAQLTPDQLRQLHKKVVKMRQDVLDLVQGYDNQSASTLVTKSFQKSIEAEFGRKKLGGKKK